jgi:two-component system sensor histidine kinase PilS (NtrC family)
MYIGRLCLAAAIFAAVAWIWKDAPPRTTLAVTLILVVTSAFTAASFWYTHVLGRRPGESVLYGQVVFDAFLVTGAIHLTGGGESTFAPLYILVICAAAVLLPLLGGLLVGLLTSILYFTDIVLGHHSTLTAGVMLQIGLFAVVAVVTGVLGDRLRQTGTALGQVETELRLLRLDTDDILGGISTGILTVDGQGHLAYLNPAAAELLSLPASQWLGKPVLKVLDEIAPGMGAAIARSAETRKPIRRYETDEIQNGSLVLGMSTTLMERGSEEDPPVTAIFQDITERKRIDTLRRRAERLEAIAELSASLAHEIKNPLASIRSAVEQLAGGGIDPDDKQLLEVLVVRESDRVSRLLAEFIDFARVKVTDPQPVDLPAVVRNVIALVRAHPDAAGRAIEAAPSQALEGFAVMGDEDLLHRAVFNLVLNAAQWAGKGGQVTVALDALDSDILSPSFGASQVLRLRVTDTGPGVPPEAIEQIFDPFFTLRPGGTGLGLALVQRAVDAHGGAIFVDAVPPPENSGGTFNLYLPALPIRDALPVDALGRKELFA